MAGHSKWANIRHRKGRQDAKRGKLFTRLIREVTVAAKLGGGDISANPRLRAAVDAALSANMPKDTIERARARGAGGLEGENFEEIRYEGYGPSGVAILVDCLTDNRNRSVADVRHVFSKSGGNLGTDGSVSYMFKKVGLVNFNDLSKENLIMEVALESGAEDVINNDDGSIDVVVEPDAFVDLKEAMVAAGLEPVSAEITLVSDQEVELTHEKGEALFKMLDLLEDLDDVQKVYTNASVCDGS